MSQLSKFVKPYVVTSGKGFRLARHDPADTGKLALDKESAGAKLREGVDRLARLQEQLYAEQSRAVLLIFQAMDAAGKDGTIKHVLSGVNPQGCAVHSFKSPSADELNHDFLWRCAKVAPANGMIGIFNRSYYEEVLAVRVHPEYLAKQRLPPECVTKHIWSERFEDIRAFERHLVRSGTVVLKFFLHLSKDEQKRRFLKRIEDQDRNWKFSASDAAERQHWDDYQAAYEDAIRNTATPDAPWIVVPADHKWYSRLVVGAAVVDALTALDLKFPTVDADARRRLQDARRLLEGD
jgi:PPK2 family polyphosphate:nucleotide phosphotransferase